MTRPWNIKLKCWWDGAFEHNGKIWQALSIEPDYIRAIDITAYIEMREV